MLMTIQIPKKTIFVVNGHDDTPEEMELAYGMHEARLGRKTIYLSESVREPPKIAKKLAVGAAIFGMATTMLFNPIAKASQGTQATFPPCIGESEPSLTYNEVCQDGTIYRADFNGDLRVNFKDMADFAKHYGSIYGDDGYDEKYDLNGDWKIDSKDFGMLMEEFGKRYKYLPLLEKYGINPGEFAKYVLSKAMTSGNDIDSKNVEEYINAVGNNGERSKWIVEHGFGMEDGVMSDEEEKAIKQYAEKGTIDDETFKNLIEFYAEKMNGKINGIGSALEGSVNNLNGNNIEKLEAAEDVEGMVERSKPYKDMNSRVYNPARESEINDAFHLMARYGSASFNEEQKKHYESEMPDKITVDGKLDDWKGVEPYSIKKNDDWVPKEYRIEQLFMAWDKQGNLDIFIKTPEKPKKDKNMTYETVIFGSGMNDSLFDVRISGGGATIIKREFYYDKKSGLYKSRARKLSGLRYAFGPDGIEIQIAASTAKQLGENIRISANTLLKEVENSVNENYLPDTIEGRTKVYPGVVFHGLPKYNVPLFLLSNIAEENEFGPSELMAEALSMTEASIFSTFDDETKAKILDDLNDYYKFMKKYDNEKLDLFDTILLVSRQSSLWNAPLYSEELRSVFSGLDQKLNKYDYAFDITSPESYKALDEMYKNYSKPEKLGIDAKVGNKFVNGMNSNGFLPIKMYVDGKEIMAAAYLEDSTNASLWNLKKYGYAPAVCTGVMKFTMDALRSRGFVPIEFDMTSPVYKGKKLPVTYTVHYQPGFVENGRIYMVPTAKPRKHDCIWLSFPSIGLSPHQTRILLTRKQSGDSLDFGIDKRDIKMELYEKWFGDN